MTLKIDLSSISIRLILPIAACALLAGTGIAGVFGGWRNDHHPSAIQQDLLPSERGPAQVVRFTVYDAGIFPREARASAGLIALHIEEMSGASTGLIVESESQRRVAQVVRRPERWRDNARISLAPGRYTVYDASRPRNRATLIIEP